MSTKKRYSADNVDGAGILGCFPGISVAQDTFWTQFGSHFQVFSLEPPCNLGIGSNQWQQWISHPQNRGILCCKPLEPTFLVLKTSGWGPMERGCTCVLGCHLYPRRQAHAPTMGPHPEAFGSRKVGFDGAESISVTSLTQFQGFKGVLG